MVANHVTQEQKDRAAKEIAESTRKTCDDHKLGLIALLNKLKSELNWKDTKTMKVRGLVRQDQLPKGFRVVATSGSILRDDEGKELAGDGETVIMWQERSGGIRQKARMDAHDLRGDYPDKGTKGGMNLNLSRPLTPEEEEYLQTAMEASKK